MGLVVVGEDVVQRAVQEFRGQKGAAAEHVDEYLVHLRGHGVIAPLDVS